MMEPNFPNDSWRRALRVYDSLIAHGWQHVGPFRQLVAAIGRSVEARGLSAFTSHETLYISAYTCYPDWRERRHVRIWPGPDGKVKMWQAGAGFAPRSVESWTLPLAEASWTVPLEEAEGLVRRLVAAL